MEEAECNAVKLEKNIGSPQEQIQMGELVDTEEI